MKAGSAAQSSQGLTLSPLASSPCSATRPSLQRSRSGLPSSGPSCTTPPTKRTTSGFGSGAKAKPVEKLEKRILMSVGVFTNPDWKQTLKGKRKALENAQVALEAEVAQCKSRRREDLLPAFERMNGVLDAGMRFIDASRYILLEDICTEEVFTTSGSSRSSWSARRRGIRPRRRPQSQFLLSLTRR